MNGGLCAWDSRRHTELSFLRLELAASLLNLVESAPLINRGSIRLPKNTSHICRDRVLGAVATQ
jgi:hypothetical protein